MGKGGVAARGRRCLLPTASMLLALAGCAGPGGHSGGYSGGHHQAGHPMYKVGSPYQIGGVWYTPAVDYNYDESGIASWYGEQFNQEYTANGEVFDLNELTAAHRTLPMPSIVQVTNLDNGRELKLRVNDRGPFARGRIIDVSRRAAQLLGFESNGTARVRVRVMRDDSIRVADLVKRNGGDRNVLVADAPSVAAVENAAELARVQSLQGSPPPPVPATAPVPSPPPGSPSMSPFQVPLAEHVGSPPPLPPAEPLEDVRSPVVVAELPPLPEKVKIVPVRTAGRIFVQAGAFSVAENAQRVRVRVTQLGSHAQVLSAPVKGVPMYRVRIGPIDSVEEADRVLSRIVGSGYPEARIVVD